MQKLEREKERATKEIQERETKERDLREQILHAAKLAVTKGSEDERTSLKKNFEEKRRQKGS